VAVRGGKKIKKLKSLPDSLTSRVLHWMDMMMYCLLTAESIKAGAGKSSHAIPGDFLLICKSGRGGSGSKGPSFLRQVKRNQHWRFLIT
jgi:hypothetical protein